MARTSGIHIEGVRETVRNLEKLGVDVEDLRAAFGAISSEVVTEAQGIVPRGETGRLAGSIKPARTKNKAVVRAGTPTGVPYAGVINYGYPARGIAPTEFLTTPANRDPQRHATTIERELEALIVRYGLT